MNFKRRYLIGISLIVILLFTNQFIIQFWLQKKSVDAYIINVSGKQRMLSQKIFGLIQYYKTTRQDEGVRKNINQSFEEWNRIHSGLIEGKLTKKVKLSANVISKLNEITPNIKFIETLIKDIDAFSNIDFLYKNQADFLVKMDNIVSLLEKESDKKLTTIIRIELVLALVTLLVVLLKIQYVFKPIIEQVRLRNKELKKKNDALEEYAYIASHDLRSPIQNLLNFLGLFKRSVVEKLDDKEKYYFKFVEDSAKRMNATTADLLNYAVANQIDAEISNINEILQDVLDDLSMQIKGKNAIIDVRNLPTEALVDRDLFRLVLQNLICNGLKFVAEDESPNIQLWSNMDKKFQYFHIKDNGIGIKKEARVQIFKLFQRLHSQEKYEGTGVGLALCKKIIEGHGGRIWLEPIKNNNGSHFVFKIPRP